MTLDVIQNAHQRYSEPIVVFFEDTETFDIIPRPFLSDVSWCDKGRPLKVCGDLGDFGESPSEMFEQLDDYIDDYLREVGRDPTA